MSRYLSFLVLFLVSNYVSAQYWELKSNDTIYYQSPIIVGNDAGETAMMSVLSEHNGYGEGGRYGIISKHSANTSYLNFKTRSRIGYSSNWSTQSQGASFAGALYLNKDNASSYTSKSAGGMFILEFDDYAPYDYSNNTHYLGGSYNTIRGNISRYPNKSVISAIIAKDQLNTEKTYAGYLEGKVYVSDNLGVGIDKPSAKIEVADGDIYISDINRGIIMKSPDGGCWRGVLDNSGNLTFNAIDCPDQEIPTSNIESQQEEQLVYDISVYPTPADKEVYIHIDGYNESTFQYTIVNMNGNLMKKDVIENSSSMDVSYLMSGVYVLSISAENGEHIANKKISIK